MTKGESNKASLPSFPNKATLRLRYVSSKLPLSPANSKLFLKGGESIIFHSVTSAPNG